MLEKKKWNQAKGEVKIAQRNTHISRTTINTNSVNLTEDVKLDFQIPCYRASLVAQGSRICLPM